MVEGEIFVETEAEIIVEAEINSGILLAILGKAPRKAKVKPLVEVTSSSIIRFSNNPNLATIQLHRKCKEVLEADSFHLIQL